ncbi:MAG: DUF3307 domain-containing protein [Cyclobacteriaceae bacterium]
MIPFEQTIIFFQLLAAHVLAAYLFKPKKWQKNWQKHEHRSIPLYIHALIAGLLSYVFLWQWQFYVIIPIIFTTHIIVNLLRLEIKRKTRAFAIGELIHLVVIFLSWLMFTRQFNQMPNVFISYATDLKFWAVASGYLLVTYPAGNLIALVTSPWLKEIKQEGLPGAGWLIGMIERVLIFTFILIGQYQAIGFLIAAKSVFRYAEIRDDADRKKAEYILTGTLLSFAIAVILGLLIEMAIALSIN